MPGQWPGIRHFRRRASLTQVSMFGLPGGSGTRCAGGSGTAIRDSTDQVRPHMHQLTRRQHPPAALPVQCLRRDHHRGDIGQPGRVHRGRRTPHVQAPRPPGRSRMCSACWSGYRSAHSSPGAATITFREETGRCRPIHAAAAAIPAADVPVVRVGLLGDQREVPLGVGVARAPGRRYGPSSASSRAQRAEASVVGHDAALHTERVGVTHRPPARRRPPDVGHERRGLGLPGGPRANSWSRKAGSGCLSSTTPPSGPK